MSYPSFYANGQECRLITREGAVSYDLVVVAVISGVETGWGGSPESGSIIVADFNDAYIMRPEGHGNYGVGRWAFICWGRDEAERRAKAHFVAPPTSDKVASVIWNLQNSVYPSADGNLLLVKPSPLP